MHSDWPLSLALRAFLGLLARTVWLAPWMPAFDEAPCGKTQHGPQGCPSPKPETTLFGTEIPLVARRASQWRGACNVAREPLRQKSHTFDMATLYAPEHAWSMRC